MLTLTYPQASLAAIAIFAAGCLFGMLFIEWLDARQARRVAKKHAAIKTWPASETGLPRRRYEDKSHEDVANYQTGGYQPRAHLGAVAKPPKSE